MALLFNRKAVLIIGEAGGQGVNVSNLRISFDVSKNDRSESNKATIKVFNAKETTRTLMDKKDTVVYLEAGYEQTSALIFAGNITKAEHTKQGVDIVSTITCGDGVKQLRDAKVRASFSKGMSVRNLLKDVFKQAFGDTPAVFNDIPNDVLKRGFTASGKAKTIIDRMTNSYGLRWSFQDGQIVVYKDGKGYGDAIYLSSSTGLIGEASKTDNGVKFKTLLMPELNAGRIVQIESKKVAGYFKIKNVKHSGDTHGANWFTECEAVEL